MLCIGLGVGIAPGELQRDGVNVDVVEINPLMVRVAKDYFRCPLEKLNLTIGDGRQFINRCGKKYDAILLDAFLSDTTPSHLMTLEAFGAMRKALRPDGVLVINSTDSLDPGKDFETASLYKTLKRVFRSVKIHASVGSNVLFVASDQPRLVMRNRLNLDEVHPVCRDEVARALACTPVPNPRSGIVLTDDYNPVEYYDAANREAYWRRMAKFAQGL